MKDGRKFLKVKVKNLAAEAKIIRTEEKRAKKDPFLRSQLALHRRTIVRQAARETMLAYAFIRGQEYQRIENNSKRQPDWKKVKAMVERYGATWESGENYGTFKTRKEEIAKKYETWQEEARQLIDSHK